MEYYIFVVIILIVFAIADLWVGVANDAVNFVNSAVGSKVAPIRIVLIVAVLGILFGVTFSSGMMEIARKGIVKPEFFVLGEILVIFLSYAICDLLLLDFYNTYGLPTSTTVSMIFGLFGGAIAVSIFKVLSGGSELSVALSYIRTDKIIGFAIAIISSVILSFIFGTLVQFVSRLIFSFDFEKNIKKWGALWGSLALTAITHFIFIEGIGGASFIDKKVVLYVESNQLLINLASFVFWAIILEIIILFTRINILKIIVLIGTFSLAMSFAANDLVNFIGAPLAALSAFEIASQTADPSTATLEGLSQPVKANTLILLGAGLIMVLSIIASKKARSVIKTEVTLGSQEDEVERFDTFGFARWLVRSFTGVLEFIRRITPENIRNYVNRRFDKSKARMAQIPVEKAPAFDLIRATVNLTVASALISYGTSLQLPLSTTYVTFIVAMSTALSDRAWGRESAVYRVSGILTVIGGWFITAVIATIVAGIIASFIYLFKLPAIIIFVGIVAFLLIRTRIIHTRREKEFSAKEEAMIKNLKTASTVFDNYLEQFNKYIAHSLEILQRSIKGISEYKQKGLIKSRNDWKKFNKQSSVLSNLLLKVIKKLKIQDSTLSKMFANALSSISDLNLMLNQITTLNIEYFYNNFKKFDNNQTGQLRKMMEQLLGLVNKYSESIKNKAFYSNDEIDSITSAIISNARELKAECLMNYSKNTINNQQALLLVKNFDFAIHYINHINRIMMVCRECHEISLKKD